jgi:hypothetical protein
MPLRGRVQQRLQLRRVALDCVKGRVQVLREAQGAQPGRHGGGGGQGGELGAGKEHLFGGGRGME